MNNFFLSSVTYWVLFNVADGVLDIGEMTVSGIEDGSLSGRWTPEDGLNKWLI